MKIVDCFKIWFVVALVCSASIPHSKVPNRRCRRFVWLIPIIIGAAVAGSGVALIVEEQMAAQLNKQLAISNRHLAVASTTTLSTPGHSSSPSTTTSPKPPSQKIVLINYDLEVFQNIPRGFLDLQVQELPSFNGLYEVEYILFDANYLGTTNYDRVESRFVFVDSDPSTNDLEELRTHDFQVDGGHYTRHLYQMQRLVNEFNDLTREIHSSVNRANSRLRTLQYQRFVRRAGELDAGIQSSDMSNDQELNDAFGNEIRSVMRAVDRRTHVSGLLIQATRNRECLEFGLDMRHHARLMGVIQLPYFSLRSYSAGYTPLSSEEQQWLRNPTMEWFPRQSTITAEFSQTAEDHPERNLVNRFMPPPVATQVYPSHQGVRRYEDHSDFDDSDYGRPFSYPSYYNYRSVLPVVGARRLLNDNVNLEFSMFDNRNPDHPNFEETESDQSQDAESFNGGSDSTDTVLHEANIPLITLDDSDVATNTIMLSDSDDSVVEIVAEINQTPNDEFQDPQPGPSHGRRRQGCNSEYQLQFKKRKHDERRDRRSLMKSPLQEIAVCNYVGGQKFRMMLNLWHKF